MNEVAKKMLTKSKNSRLEKFGKTITFLCMSLIVVVVAMILIFVATTTTIMATTTTIKLIHKKVMV